MQENWIRNKTSLCIQIHWLIFKTCLAKWKCFQWCFLGSKLVAHISLGAHVSFPGVQRSDHYCHLLQRRVVPSQFGLVSFSLECLYRCIHPHVGRVLNSLRISKLKSQNNPMFSQRIPNQEKHSRPLLILSFLFLTDLTPLPQNVFCFYLFSFYILS